MSQSAERMLVMIQFLAQNELPLGLMEIAARLGYDKSTAARLLQTLESAQFLCRDPVSKRYRLGPGLIAIAAAISRKVDFLQLIRSHLERLRDATGETISLHLRVGDERVCVDGFESTQGLLRALPLGESIPLYRGSAAKAILAFLPPTEIENVLAKAEDAQVDIVFLRRELAHIREQGYVAVIGDRLAGVGTLSVPLVDAAGVFGSMTIAGPADRWTLERMHAFAPAFKATAAVITATMRDADQPAYSFAATS